MKKTFVSATEGKNDQVKQQYAMEPMFALLANNINKCNATNAMVWR